MSSPNSFGPICWLLIDSGHAAGTGRRAVLDVNTWRDALRQDRDRYRGGERPGLDAVAGGSGVRERMVR